MKKKKSVSKKITMMLLFGLFLCFPLALSAETNVSKDDALNQGVYFANKGMLDAAIVEFSKVIKIDPNNAQAYYNRATAYAEKGNFYEAISDFDKAIEINPNLSFKEAIVFKVISGAMEPTISTGEKISIDRFAYLIEIPKRGDVIVFKYPNNQNKILLKRIVGLPNETVAVKNGQVLINDIILREPEIFTKTYYYNRGDYSKEGQVVKIPADSYYVLGDNSKASMDSRYWGFLPKEDVLGKVILIKSLDDKIRQIK